MRVDISCKKCGWRGRLKDLILVYTKDKPFRSFHACPECGSSRLSSEIIDENVEKLKIPKIDRKKFDALFNEHNYTFPPFLRPRCIEKHEVICNECKWGGMAKDLVGSYRSEEGIDEHYAECPKCGSEDWEYTMKFYFKRHRK